MDTYPAAKIVIAGGICDCTHRNSRYEKFICDSTTVTNMSSYIMALFEDSNQRIRAEKPNAKVCYSQMIGMNLTVYKNAESPLPVKQELFDATTIDMNTKLVALNEKNNMPTPLIAKRVYVPQKNGFHHQYCRLNDGIHWDYGFKRACADKFVNEYELKNSKYSLYYVLHQP